MRHSSFATTEKHYGAIRSVEAAASEVQSKLPASANSFVGQFVGSTGTTPDKGPVDPKTLKAFP